MLRLRVDFALLLGRRANRTFLILSVVRPARGRRRRGHGVVGGEPEGGHDVVRTDLLLVMLLVVGIVDVLVTDRVDPGQGLG